MTRVQKYCKGCNYVHYEDEQCVVTRVHNGKNKNCPVSSIAVPQERHLKHCNCTPTIQHEEENKECHCNAYEGHPQCSFCTCSRQDEALIPEQVKMLESEDRHTIELPRNYGKSMFTSPTGEKQDWSKEKYIEMWDNGEFSWNGDIKNSINPERMWQVFVEPAITSAKDEGRREGYEDGKALRGKEWKQDIEEVRLEVIAQVEEWWSNYKYKDEGGDYIWDDLLRFMRSLKTNSK